MVDSEAHNNPAGDDHVEKILRGMSIEDKIGQMSQVDVSVLMEPDPSKGPNHVKINQTALRYFIGELGVGSVFNLVTNTPWSAHDYRRTMIQIQECAHNYSRPPVIWGIDSVHGANFVHGATLTPQPLNIAATFNTSMAYEAGRLASRDTRAAGMTWLFSPLVGLAVEPRWSRVYETFGEDPVVVGAMATQMIQGIQVSERYNSTAIPSRAAACAKHFIGYSAPKTGHDRSPAWVPKRHLYQYFVPPWKQAIAEGGVMSVMESYSEIDGVPMASNPEALNYLLRQRLEFDGLLVTDFQEIDHLQSWHRVTPNATKHALSETSIDISMIPMDAAAFRVGVLEALADQAFPADRIHESAKRVLKLKQKLYMFDEQLSLEDPNLELVGGDEQLALRMVRESIVLAKNKDDLLPLSSSLKIHVTGPTSNSRVYQSGGWVHQWQGAPDESWFTYGATVTQALKNSSYWATVTNSCGTDILGQDCEPQSISKAVEAAKLADVVVVCAGEEAYAEKPGDIRSLSLPRGQYDLVAALSTETEAKIVLVYFGGRPRLLNAVVDQVDAVLIGFLPGPSAGEALSEILSGRVNPSGRLPITYPLAEDGGGSPYFHSVSDQCTSGDEQLPHYSFMPCGVEWPFGHGLSYTTFSYSDFVVSGGFAEDLQLSVKVKNTGKVGGAETVLFFTFDDFRRTTPEYKRLRAFEKVLLEPDQETTISKTISAEDLLFVGSHDDRRFVGDPQMTFWVGVGPETDCRSDGAETDGLCAHIEKKEDDNTVTTPYIGACEAACKIWSQSGCSSHVGLSSHGCLSMCTAVNDYPSIASDLVTEGWGFNYVNCIENVVTGFKRQNQLHDTDHCYKMTTLCRDIFRTPKMDEFGAGGAHERHPKGMHGQTPVSYAIALLAAIISSLIIFHALFGRMDIPRSAVAAEDDAYRLLEDESDGDQQHDQTHASQD